MEVKKVMWAIIKKEVLIYFFTPFAYIFIGMFLLLTGIVFSAYNLSYSSGDTLGMLEVLNYVSIVIFPVLTMKLLADEKKMNTDQLLFTSPIKVISIILGKYFAAFFVFLVALASTNIYIVFIIIYGKTSIGAIIGSYLGFILMGATYTAICLFASSITDNQVTAALAGFAILFGSMLLGFIENSVSSPFLKELIKWLSISAKYKELTNGVLTISPLIYYLSFTFLFLLLTIYSVESKLRDKEA